jgi:hypothetical protein
MLHAAIFPIPNTSFWFVVSKSEMLRIFKGFEINLNTLNFMASHSSKKSNEKETS